MHSISLTYSGSSITHRDAHDLIITFSSKTYFNHCSFFSLLLLSVVVVLRLRLPEPAEELRGGLDGHALALLLGRVGALLPSLEALVRENVLLVQDLEDLVQKLCKKSKIKSKVLNSLFKN